MSTARAGASCSSASSPSAPARCRCCSTPTSGRPTQADDLDWIALLASCAAFDSYCKVFTADLQPDRIAKLLLVHPEFPYSVRYVGGAHVRLARRDHRAVARAAIARRSSGSSAACARRSRSRRCPELLAGDLHAFLNGVLEQCRALHAAVHDAYIDYPIEVAFES